VTASHDRGRDLYLPPYERFAHCLRKDGTDQTITLPIDIFQLLLRTVATAAGFDEASCRGANHPDVAASVKSGSLPNALTHFCENGYAEGRRPGVFPVNARWYRKEYPDFDRAIRAGKDRSAQAHYNSNGYAEGRAPQPEVAAEVARWNAAIARHKREEAPTVSA
jgi:hypothetical protein